MASEFVVAFAIKAKRGSPKKLRMIKVFRLMNKQIASRKVFVVKGIVWTFASKNILADFAIVIPRQLKLLLPVAGF